MHPCYFSALALLLALPATAQTGSPAAASDTLKTPFRGTLPDSLAALPTPGGTFQVQGQPQPIRPFATVQDQLRTVAGVQVTPYDGSPGSGNVVRIRGASVVQSLAQPLYIIDGLPALNDELTPDQAFGLSPALSPNSGAVAEQHAAVGSNPLLLLPPETIESVEVLAGPAAVARYGPLGANGVVSIRTRRGTPSAPTRVRYSAYAGVQQMRQAYPLLSAKEYATLQNDFVAFSGGALPYPATQLAQLGAGTDWQAEAYRAAGLQQHQLSLEGQHANTTYAISADYRQQSGLLHNQDLHRYGLRLALDQRVSDRLTLRGTATLGQTTQHQPYTADDGGATRAALMAPPARAVRTAQGAYDGLSSDSGFSTDFFANPVALSEYVYRTPRTRRLLAQVAADYQLAPHLTVQAAADFQRTLLDAESNTFYYQYSGSVITPSVSQPYANQVYRTSQWAGRLALRYQRQLGAHHQLGAELDYQYQAFNYFGSIDYHYGDRTKPGSSYSGSYYQVDSKGPRLHRPWASLRYALDSTLEVQAGLSYGHYRHDQATRFYPSAQVRWRTQPGPLNLSLWLGAARTSIQALGFGSYGVARLALPGTSSYLDPPRYQSAFYNDQVEAGLRLGQRGGRLTGQLVAYQRTSYHVLLPQVIALPTASGYGNFTLFSEGTVRNQGLELSLAATWQAGRVQGTTALAASANRNRVQDDASLARLSPTFDNQPVATSYGYQQEGLTANGSLQFRDTNGDGFPDPQLLGSGIPAQLASLSQQLRLGRLALDAQLDGLFSYQVVNYQLAFLDVPTTRINSATTVLNRWTPTNQATTVPAAGRESYGPYSRSNQLSNRLLENGSNVRLSSLTITYRLRQTATQELSVWVGSQNLFVLSQYRGYDPNVSSGGSAPALAGQDYGAVPVPRTWLLGVRASL